MMIHRRGGFRAALGTLVATAALWACSDSIGPNPAAPTPAPTGGTLRTDAITCTAQVRAGTVSCASPAPRTGAAAALLVGSSTYVKLTSSNVSYSSGTEIFQFDVTVQNLIPQALGTLDGATSHPDGIRVFFGSPPATTAGSGMVTVANTDGVGTFTASNQDYFQYDSMLVTNQTSPARNWQLNVPAGVETFAFLLFVSAEVQYPDGWVDVTPASAQLSAGGTVNLSATVRNAFGNTIPGAPVRFASGLPGVADVDSITGLVTAVSDGTATITATSTTRTGTALITVSTPDSAQSTITASPTLLAYTDSSTVTVQLVDGGGAPLTQGGDVVTLGTDFGTLTSVVDAGNGTYTAKLAAASPGTATVTGTVNGSAIIDDATVVFTSGPAASMVRTAGNAQSATVGTAVATAPQVQVLDAQSNPVAGVMVVFSVTGGGGSVTLDSALTSATGHASVGSWTLGTAAGANTLLAQAGALSQTFSATGTAGAPASMTKTAGDTQVDSIDAVLATAPAVTVLDAFGNPVPGVAVTFAPAAGNNGSVTGGSTTTNASGVATVGSWKLGTTVKLDSLTATAAGPLTVRFTATVTVGNAATMTAQVPLSQTSVKGQAVPAGQRPSVLIADRHGNPRSGLTVTFTLGAGSGSATGTTPATSAGGIATVGSWTLSNGNGQANVMTASRAGLTSVVFTITGTN
jgi:hypothetical protein